MNVSLPVPPTKVLSPAPPIRVSVPLPPVRTAVVPTLSITWAVLTPLDVKMQIPLVSLEMSPVKTSTPLIFTVVLVRLVASTTTLLFGPLLTTNLLPTDATVKTLVWNITLLLTVFGSPTSGPTVALLAMTVPGGVAAATWTVSVNVAVSPESRYAIEAEAVPAAPTAGALRVQASVAVEVARFHETKVVPVGIKSVRFTFAWPVGPLLLTVMV